MAADDIAQGNSIETSAVWGGLVSDAGSPGFSVRTTYPTNADGVEVMLEHWEAGTEEPPHSHPGDDMTIVVEGMMTTQRYIRQGDSLVLDGELIVLHKGGVGYTRANRIHDATYVEECQLVYVHNGAFAFNKAEVDADK